MAITAAQLNAVISVQGADTAKSQLQSVGESVNSTGGLLKSALGGALSLAAGAAGVALGFLKDQLVDSVKIAMEHQQVMAQTAQAIKSTGDASGMTTGSISNLATALSQVTPFSEDAIQSGENLLLTFTGIGKDVFPQTTQAMLDLSQATGQDMKSSAIQLGKALDDPLTGMTALSRVGVTFSAQEKEQIKTMMAHNDVIGAQKVILNELNKEFGGSATAAGKTFGGQVQILQNDLEDLKEKIGSALLPILNQFLGFVTSQALPLLTKFSDWFSKTAGPALQQFAGMVTKALGSLDFGKLQGGLKGIDLSQIVSGLRMFGQVVMNLSPAVTLFQVLTSHARELGQWFQSSVIPALHQAEPGFANLGKALVGLAPVVMEVSAVIHSVMATAFNALIPIIEKATPLFIQVAGIIANVLGAAIKFLTPYLLQATHAIGQFADEVITRVQPIIMQWLSNAQVGLNDFLKIWNAVWPSLAPILLGVWNVIKGIVQVAWSLISGIILVGLDLLSGNWSQAWTDIKNTLSGVWSGIVSILTGVNQIVIGLITGLINGVIALFTHLWDELTGHSIIPDMVNEIVAWIGQLPGRVLAFINAMVSQVIAQVTAWKDQAVNTATAMVVGFGNMIASLPGRAMAGITSFVSQATSTLSNLASQASTWASDMINNFVSGILAGVGAVGSAVSSIASTISAHLHFSKPDIGPLADADTYMPDFMDLLATGLTQNTSKLKDAVRGVAGTLSNSFSAPSLTSSLPGGISGVSGIAGAQTIQVVVSFAGQTSQGVPLNLTMNSHQFGRTFMPMIVQNLRTISVGS